MDSRVVWTLGARLTGRPIDTSQGSMMALIEKPFSLRLADGGALVVSGQIDMMSAEDFLTTALAMIDRTREVVLDVADLTYVDSAAVRAIVRLGIEARHGVLLHSPHPNVMSMLDMIEVEHLAGILRVER